MKVIQKPFFLEKYPEKIPLQRQSKTNEKSSIFSVLSSVNVCSRYQRFTRGSDHRQSNTNIDYGVGKECAGNDKEANLSAASAKFKRSIAACLRG